MNTWILVPVGILALALIIFLVWKNRRDEKKIVQQMEHDYRHPKDDEQDADPEENLH